MWLGARTALGIVCELVLKALAQIREEQVITAGEGSLVEGGTHTPTSPVRGLEAWIFCK